MMIQKKILCSAEIETFLDCWGQFIVGGVENGGQDAPESVGRLFEVRKNSWLIKSL